MLHLINTRFRTLICLVCFLLPSHAGFATHIVGTDLRYEWVTGNTYKIILAVYADCGPASAGAFASLPTSAPKICIYDGGTYVDAINLAIESPSTGTEVTPTLCPGDSSQCMSMSSITPGIQLFRYSSTYTLPGMSAVWRFLFNGDMVAAGAGRAFAITNILSSGATKIQLEDTLNNTMSHNTNPVLNVVPLPYYAINMWHTYNPAAVDAEGDSLVYSLVSAMDGTTTCTSGAAVTYISGITSDEPLVTSPGAFAFGENTGQIAFYPNILQRGVLVYHIREFRGGVLVGTIQREMTVLVNTDANNLPAGGFSAPMACSLTDTLTLAVCDTVGSFSAEIHGADADAADTIFVTPFGVPAGASLTIADNGTPHPISTFSWNATSAGIGIYTFFLKYSDNACPMSGTQTIAYTVKVVDCMSLPTSTIKNQFQTTELKIFPNPSTGEFTLDWGQPIGNTTITVTDIYGRVVKQQTFSSNMNKVSIDLRQLSEGNYTVRAISSTAVRNEKITILR